MRVDVLGPLEVSDDGHRIEVSRPLERALLTLLAADVGRVVTSDRLIDGLWGETPPATAAKALQTYIHHLRSLFPEDSISTKGSGYQLDLEPTEVDAHRFVQAVTEAREAAAEDPESTVARLGEALSWWRGEPLVDAGDADVVRPLRVKLEAVRLQAQVDMTDAQLGLGDHERAAIDLHSLVDEHPLREDLWNRYMLALYRSGRQADALRAFETVRGILIDALGIEPGPELQALLDRILAQDPSLTPSPIRRPMARAPSSGNHPAPGSRLATLLLVTSESTEALEATRSVLARFGGMIVDEDDSRALAVFGAPIAREDDTYRAIRASLEVGEALARAGEGRCVVSTGPVTLPFDTSSRISAEDDPLDAMLRVPGRHPVLVDDHTRRLMSDAFDWEEAGSFDSRVMWRPTTVRRTADKARLGRRLRAPLAGRESEMKRAAQMLESLERGIGGVLLLSGDAGVGKTRMITELRRSSSGIGINWLLGHCDPYGEATPYWPFRDLIRSWLGLGIDEKDLISRRRLAGRLDELTGGATESARAYLANMLGLGLDADQRDRLALAPEAIQYRTFEVVAELLAAITRESPTAMVIEDVHWSDPTSIELLANLIELAQSRRLLMVITSRPYPDHPSRRIAERARHRVPHLTTEITLETLGASDQRALLTSLLGTADLPPDATEKILGLAEGNPFYLEELIGSLIDEGALAPSGSGWAFDAEAALIVPETVEKVVQSRIDRLDSSTHRVLTSASVLGRSFGLPLLQGIADEEGGVLPALQDLLRSDLLVEARRWPQAEYLFKHALTREAAYRTLTEERRRELHQRAATWLERQFASNSEEIVEVLAWHWTAAGLDDKATVALLRAGDLARSRHALEEAIEHYRKLLPMLERKGDKATTTLVLLKLG
ncbi:MAG: BTAD domain-containing putative transcriptional regulator, partial [Acidimicrobiia bacterium]